MLFALFTAAGTTYFMSGQGNQTSVEPGRPRPRTVAPATTAAQQSLEPDADEVQAPIATPTAVGPLGANPKSARSFPAAAGNPQSEITPTVAMPAPTLARANGTPLPKVQTTDPHDIGVEAVIRHTDKPGAGSPARAPAVARLSGSILEAPSRQAHHDDNQSSVH